MRLQFLVAALTVVLLSVSLYAQSTQGGSDAPQQQPHAQRPSRVHVSRGVAQALLINSVQPQYPDDAKQARIQGQVVLQALIDKKGDVDELTLVSGHPALAPAAVAAVKHWKYKPYLLNGEAVAMETQIVVNFQLPGR
jgi:protein TonB